MTDAKGRVHQLKIIAGEELDKPRLFEWLSRCGRRRGENRWPLQVRVFDGDADILLASDTMFHAGEFTRTDIKDGDDDEDESPKARKGRAAEKAVEKIFGLLEARPDVLNSGMDRVASILGGPAPAAGTGINRQELRALIRQEVQAVLQAIDEEEEEEADELESEVAYLRDELGRMALRLESLEEQSTTTRKVVHLERG